MLLKKRKAGNNMKILFINGSPNPKGHTYNLFKEVIKDKEVEILNITDYRINCYGQNLDGDELDKVLDRINFADTIIIGSPLYWHNICGSIRNLLDRFYKYVEEDQYKGKKLLFIFQGYAPEDWMLEAGDYTMDRFSKLYGFKYLGMITNSDQAKSFEI